MDIVQRVNGLSHLGAAWVLWLLVALSVVGVAIVIERAVVLWLGRDDVRRIRSELTLALSARDVERARHRLQESPSVEAKVASVALECEDPGAARERIASASALARLDLSKNLGFLGTLGNNAPFVGLFGTVIGIIRAFQALEHSAGQVSAGLMSEIGEALVATAVGLLVALPAVAFFNLFQRVIAARVSRAEALGGEVVAFLEAESHRS
ncbi:MAG: MotA/TolQ/ExbB proton channel family protein [Myxococcales bacterium]|nr:MotA/TolQ/ExbB proton channel family protein [Myxococcales bacterium]